MKTRINLLQTIFLLIILTVQINAQSIYEPVDISKVKSSLKEFGTMWTFDSVPIDNYEKEYGFRPTQEWLDKVRLSALQFANWCSASFVSEDGLILTNHHCGRQVLQPLSPEGKDYLRDGYYAERLDKEPKIPNIYFDQLIMIQDVTNEIIDAMNLGTTTKDKVEKRDLKIKEIELKYSEETKLVCKVVQLYNGGKFSLYGYKRYNDIRLVMAPDFQIASTGWDWDNFTYPRYELDFMFFRAYENDKPVKTENYFKFSKKGADEGELVFVIGRPGSTQRQLSVAQLEYFRDKTYKYNLAMMNELYDVYFELFQKYPERYSELLNMVMSIGNGRKSIAGRYLALRDEYIMTKKRDFENQLKEKVYSDKSMKEKYGHIWEGIQNAVAEQRKLIDDLAAYSLQGRSRSIYYEIAEKVIKYASQMKLSESERDSDYKGEKLNSTLQSILPKGIDVDFQKKLLRAQANYISSILGDDNAFIRQMYNGNKGNEAAEYLITKSMLTSEEKINELLKLSPEKILGSDDPFIKFLSISKEKIGVLRPKMTEAENTITVLNQMLGEVIYMVYGDQIPPDATSTLRISEGRVEGYEYNGTIAPSKTTYFGLWDRWHSFGKKDYPWGLHPQWQKIPEGFDLSVPIGFASSNDIVGGNSGSALININREVIGIAHDGNLESLAGDFIFLKENNRTVSTDSWGLVESLKHIFKTKRLVEELETGKL
jgi:hypothetical protein